MILTILIIILTLNRYWNVNGEVYGKYIQLFLFSLAGHIQGYETSDSTLRNLTTSLKTKQDQLERRVRAIETTQCEVSPIDYTICNSNKDYTGVLYDLRPEFVQFGLNFTARYCENGWTVIQRRGITGLNFTRSWEEYRKGFGSLSEDFWFGNDFIHVLTHLHNLTLRIELEGFEQERGYAEYNVFKIGNERDDYKLHVGGYSGNIGDSLSGHNFRKFSTPDRDTDCATPYKSGWWFTKCFVVNLNGIYYNEAQLDPKGWLGIIWSGWKQNSPLKESKMMVRPK